MEAPTGRRSFMAGAAGIAAGAALLGTASPAGAATTTDDIFPFWVDETADPDVITPLDLGTGGLAEATWVAEGELCAMTLRIVVGAEADLGTGFWGLDGADFPVGYRPIINSPAPLDIGFAWLGSGFVFDLGQTTQASYHLIPIWGNFSGTGGPAAGMLWFAPGLPGTPQRLGDASGTAPFGAPLNEGAIVSSSMVYQRVVPEV